LAHQQILTIIQTRDSFFFRIHATTIMASFSIVNLFVLRKSYNKIVLGSALIILQDIDQIR